MRVRQALAMVLAALAGLALVAGAAGWQLRATFADAGRFGDRAVAALDEPAIRQAVADVVADEAMRDGAPEAQARTASAATVDTATFRGDFRRAAEALQAGLADGRGGALRVELDPGLREADPQLAALLGPVGEVEVIALGQGDLPVRGPRALDLLRVGAGALLALACFALAGALALARDRWGAVLAAAVATAVAGALLVLALQLGRGAAVDATEATGAIDLPTAQAAVEAIWDTLTGGLLVTGAVALVAGVLAGIGAGAARSGAAARR